MGSATILVLKLLISMDTSSKTLEQFACEQRNYSSTGSSSCPNILTHYNAVARKAIQLLLQTVKLVLDSHVVVVDKDEEVVGVLMVEVMEDEE